MVWDPTQLAMLALVMMAPELWFAHRISSDWFGFGKTLKWVYGLPGMAAVVLSVFSAEVGAMLLGALCAGGLKSMELFAGISENVWFCLVGGFALGWAFGMPMLIFALKRRRFWHVMEVLAPRCNACGYALRGLPVVRGRVRCPECGKKHNARRLVKRFRHEKRVLDNSRKRPWEL